MARRTGFEPVALGSGGRRADGKSNTLSYLPSLPRAPVHALGLHGEGLLHRISEPRIDHHLCIDERRADVAVPASVLHQRMSPPPLSRSCVQYRMSEVITPGRTERRPPHSGFPIPIRIRERPRSARSAASVLQVRPLCRSHRGLTCGVAQPSRYARTLGSLNLQRTLSRK